MDNILNFDISAMAEINMKNASAMPRKMAKLESETIDDECIKFLSELFSVDCSNYTPEELKELIAKSKYDIQMEIFNDVDSAVLYTLKAFENGVSSHEHKFTITRQQIINQMG